jgi:hypothetical protein
MQYQLRKMDEHNWQLWRWQEGGETITRGRYAGQDKQAKWCPMDNYYGKLEHAAAGLFEVAVKDRTESGTDLDTETILVAIADAQAAVLAAVQAVTPDEFSKKSARGRKPNEA